MRLPWRKPDHSGLEEAKAHLAQSQSREVEVARVIERTDRAIRTNHFGPRIAAALREAHR